MPTTNNLQPDKLSRDHTGDSPPHPVTRLAAYGLDNRPPGHLLGPTVRDSRHIHYRPLPNLGRGTPPILLPPHAFEVFLGRHLLGKVVRYAHGDWGAVIEADGTTVKPQPTRAAAARGLLTLAHEHGHHCEATNDHPPCPAGAQRVHRCYVAPLGRPHYCRCVCGTYL